MSYDFETVTDRRGTDSTKWQVKENELPMWVADMDFKTAPEIIDAMRVRLEHGIFGYGEITPEWYDAYTGWWKNRYGFEMDPKWLVFCTGVIPAISSIVRKLTTPGENVVIQTPVYNIFFNSILNNGRVALESPLKYDDGNYSMDFEDLEKKFAMGQTTLMLLCNPQNPSGNIWDRQTLAKVGELAKKHHVTVVSDEIHCDITRPGMAYVPFASVSDSCREVSITCIAPTKTFNLAGLHTAAVSVPDPDLRHKVWRALNTDEVAEPCSFAVPSAVAAYKKGESWLTGLREYVFENRRFAGDYISENIPGAFAVKGDATYLLWIDISAISSDSRKTAAMIRSKTGLFITGGAVFGTGGEGFLRMNIACPRSVLSEGLSRLKAGLAS